MSSAKSLPRSLLIMLFFLIFITFSSTTPSYAMLPNSRFNRTQSCQVNCTRNQTTSDRFQKIPECVIGHYDICEAYLGIDFTEKAVSYSFTTANSMDNSSTIRADLVGNYLAYMNTDITAIRFRQLIMKFSKTNPYRLNINYFCRTQIDDCAYEEIQTIYPVYIANQQTLKRIQPIFYDETRSSGSPIACLDDISNEKTTLCSGYCTLTLNLHTMTKGCNESLSSDTLGINMSLGLAYPDNPTFTAQVSSLTLVCNKANCNSNRSIADAIALANHFLTAQANEQTLLASYSLIFFVYLSNKL